MNAFEIAIVAIIGIGICIALYIFFNNPIGFFKELFRGMKEIRGMSAILFFFIWGPVWVIDKIFNLKIFINTIEEASVERDIDFKNFSKYILIKPINRDQVISIISRIYSNNDPEFDCDLTETKFSFSSTKRQVIIKVSGNITFKSFKTILFFIDNSIPPPKSVLAIGILLNNNNSSDSYYFYNEWEPEFKLIGRDTSYAKIYVELNPEIAEKEKVFLNTNLNIKHRLNFKHFQEIANEREFLEVLLPRT